MDSKLKSTGQYRVTYRVHRPGAELPTAPQTYVTTINPRRHHALLAMEIAGRENCWSTDIVALKWR